MLFLLSGFFDVPQCDFIHIYSASDWSNFLDLWMCNFQHIYEMFSHYFFKYFPQCCLLWDSNYRYIKMSHTVPYTTNILFQYFSILHFGYFLFFNFTISATHHPSAFFLSSSIMYNLPIILLGCRIFKLQIKKTISKTSMIFCIFQFSLHWLNFPPYIGSNILILISPYSALLSQFLLTDLSSGSRSYFPTSLLGW